MLKSSELTLSAWWCRKRDHIFHFTSLIYYILTHLSRSIFRRKEKTKPTLPGRKRASRRAKYRLYVFQQTYIEETMFSCHPQLRLGVHQSYIIVNKVTFWSKPFFPQLHNIIALETVANMKATIFQSGADVAWEMILTFKRVESCQIQGSVGVEETQSFWKSRNGGWKKNEYISLRGYHRWRFSESAILNDITSPALMQRFCFWWAKL